MAANTTLNPGASGDTIRTLDKTTYKTPVSAIDLGGTGAESLLVVGQQAMAGSVPVVLASNQSAIPVTGTFWQATQPVSGTVTANAGTGNFATTSADGANGTLGAKADAKNAATDTTAISAMSVLKQISASVQAPPSQAVTNAGTFAVQAAQFGTWTVQPGNTPNSTPWLANHVASPTGGYTPGKLISAASTNGTSVKGSAGTVGYIIASNINASPRYLKIYNKASAPTVGTDTPVHTFIIPGNTSGAGTNIPLPACGLALGTGFAFAITTGVADADTGAVAASDIVINYGYN